MPKRFIKIESTNTKSFIHLHCHSGFTMLGGVNKPEELIDFAKSLGMESIALTDTNGLYGVVKFYRYANESGIKPILGAEIVTETEKAVLIAEDNGGFKRICEIVTALQLSQQFLSNSGLINQTATTRLLHDKTVRNDISPSPTEGEGMRGVIARSDSDEAISTFIYNNGGDRHACPLRKNNHRFNFSLIEALKKDSKSVIIISEDENLLRNLRLFIPQNYLYVELIAHKKSSHLKRLLSLARELNLPVVGTNDVYFINEEDYEIHKILTAIKERATIDSVDENLLAQGQAFLKSSDEMKNLFSLCPEAVSNTYQIVERCKIKLPIGKLRFPKFKVPEGESDFSYLQKLCYQGVEKRYFQSNRRDKSRPDSRGLIHQTRKDDKVTNRLNYELNIINQMGYSSYFLIVWDIVNFAKTKGIPTVGRGSAADSIVSYLLGITNVDPIKYDLYFERFLNPERIDPPDIDVDLCWKRRDEVLNYVYEKYGAEYVAMICTFVTFAGRSTIREVGKAMGLSNSELTTYTQHIPHRSAKAIEQAMELLPESRELPVDDELFNTILRVAKKIDGLPRHLSIHPGGIVISPEPLTTNVPLQYTTKGIVVTQYDMYQIEDLGLLKIDLLGQRSLSVIADTVKMIEKNHNIKIDIQNIDYEDELLISLLKDGKTIGCFQIESPGMRALLKKCKANNYELVVALSSVIRPGPSDSGMMKKFIRRHLKLERVRYTHPSLEEILKSTYGIMVYQEDVLKIASSIAGMSLGRADLLRRAMSKKRSAEKMNAMKKEFIQGAINNNVSERIAKEIWRQMRSFAGYAFCKAHSASYSDISFQAVYLKAHYPAEFMACVISNGGGFYDTHAYISEARRMGLKILLPCVNESEMYWIGRLGENESDSKLTPLPCPPPQGGRGGWGIRVGLIQVKGLKYNTLERVVKEREKGRYKSFLDFYKRVQPTYSECETLIKSGVFHSFNYTTPQLLWQLDRLSNATFMSQGSHEMNLVLHKCNANFGLQKKLHTPSASQTPLSRGDLFVVPALAGSFLPTKVGTTNCHAGGDFKNHDINVALRRDESCVMSIPELPEYSDKEKLLNEISTLDIAVSNHPLILYKGLRNICGATSLPQGSHEINLVLHQDGLISSIEMRKNINRKVKMVGWMVTNRRVYTVKGEYMKFLTLEDFDGIYEAVMFPKAYQKFGNLVITRGPYIISGKINNEYGYQTIIVDEVELVSDKPLSSQDIIETSESEYL